MEAEKFSGNSPPNLQHPISIFFGGVQQFFFLGMRKNNEARLEFPIQKLFLPRSRAVLQAVWWQMISRCGYSSDQFTTLVIWYTYIHMQIYTYIYIYRERERESMKSSFFMFSYTTSYRNNIYIYTHLVCIYTNLGDLYIYIHIYVTYTTLSTFGSWKKKSAVKEPRFISRLYNSPRVHGSPLLNWERRQAEKIAGWLRVF